MPVNDSQIVIPGQGHIYAAPIGTPAPANLIEPEAPWDDVGHSSTDKGITITREGGKVKVIGTWINPSMRERREPAVFAVTMHLHQVSNEVLGYYFGGGDTSGANVFGVPVVPLQLERALYVRIIDGSNEIPFYVPRVSLFAEDDVEVDVEKFLAFPVRATFLGSVGSNLMEWIGPDLGATLSNEVQLVTIAGAPTGGTFTLSFDGDTTAPIARNATAAQVQSALNYVSGIGFGNCIVSGVAGGPWTVSFINDLAHEDVDQMTATGSFTGGTTPTVTVTTSVPGGA